MRKESITLLLFIISLLSQKPLLAQDNKPLDAEYVFKLGITYEVLVGKPNKSGAPIETTAWYSGKKYSGIEMSKGEGMFSVYDIANNRLLMFMVGQKMAMSMDMSKMGQKIDSMKKQHPEKANIDNDFKVSKTGKSGKVLGYTCEQYQITSKKSNSLIWITRELGTGFANFSQIFPQMMKSNPSGSSLPDLSGVNDGIMLKMETISSETGDITKMEAKSIHKEGKTIKTAEYKLMAMPGH
ncbi:DUF4412 domain-containing protein [Flavihumibacter fluvii]|uniref:DUF4412 domain-containing protein n=1 Tax=Flavihumibacter fluvii TaxID=2838157 RepID=UPI001BDE188B|nr:DUF4412 domain-containing protein [Flavihumibacter fluvii]ULQ52051.1 DUF4412 domain-containing protein [Flavihumibacter fluvii]